MKLKKTIQLGSVFSLAVGAAQGAVWTEIGDAGDIFTTGVQVPTGTGSLDGITGDTTGSQVDAYLIRITDTAGFYATTAIELGNGTGTSSYDTLLTLFTPGGIPLYYNDDGPGATGFRSYLSDPSTFPGGALHPSATGGSTIVPGDYILAITSYAGDPTDAGNVPLFVRPEDNDDPYTSLYGKSSLAGPGAAWEGGDEGSYTIELGGATFVPEPSSALLGLLGLTAVLRRRR